MFKLKHQKSHYHQKPKPTLVSFLVALGYHEVMVVKNFFRLGFHGLIKLGQAVERLILDAGAFARFLLLLPIKALGAVVNAVALSIYTLVQTTVSFFFGVEKVATKTATAVSRNAKKTTATLSYWQRLFGFAAKRYALLTKRAVKKQTGKLTAVSLKPQPLFLRQAFSFAIVVLIILSPAIGYKHYRFFLSLKDSLITSASAAIGDVLGAKSAVENKNFSEANDKFASAGENFLKAEQDLTEVNSVLFSLAQIVPNSKVKMAAFGPVILEAGRYGTTLGSSVTLAMGELFNEKTPVFTTRLAGFLRYGHEAVDSSSKLSEALNKISPEAVPDDYRQQFVMLRDKSVFIKDSIVELVDIADKLQVFLGADTDKRYLLVFQNNTEARATGGFMGSFSIVDFSRGQIKSMVTPGGGTYDTEAGLRKFVAAPEPMRLLNPLWHLWDCNWWPDWPTSAKKIMWFYANSDGSSVDGVISLTPTVIMDLLTAVGPVDMPDYKVTVTADNFLDVTQYFAEQKDQKSDTPKKIIGDLSDKLIQKISQNPSKEQLIKILGVIETSLNKKDILLYFTDQSLQTKVKEQGWDGATKTTELDYLSVINTNIGGQKTDRKIKQTIEHQAVISQSGLITDTLLIKKQHTGIRGDDFYGVRNVNWLRVYVPLGSKLVSAEGFKAPDSKLFEQPQPEWETDPLLKNELEADIDPASGLKIYREGDKTVFAGWTMVDPGETLAIKLVYTLPFGVKELTDENTPLENFSNRLLNHKQLAMAKYTLLIQKQAGDHNTRVVSRVTPASGQRTLWQYPEALQGDYFALDTDQYWAYLLSR